MTKISNTPQIQAPAFKSNAVAPEETKAQEKAPEEQSHMLRNTLVGLGAIAAGGFAAKKGWLGKSAQEKMEKLLGSAKKEAENLAEAGNKENPETNSGTNNITDKVKEEANNTIKKEEPRPTSKIVPGVEQPGNINPNIDKILEEKKAAIKKHKEAKQKAQQKQVFDNAVDQITGKKTLAEEYKAKLNEKAEQQAKAAIEPPKTSNQKPILGLPPKLENEADKFKKIITDYKTAISSGTPEESQKATDSIKETFQKYSEKKANKETVNEKHFKILERLNKEILESEKAKI